jgi:hypothetical protein
VMKGCWLTSGRSMLATLTASIPATVKC